MDGEPETRPRADIDEEYPRFERSGIRSNQAGDRKADENECNQQLGKQIREAKASGTLTGGTGGKMIDETERNIAQLARLRSIARLAREIEFTARFALMEPSKRLERITEIARKIAGEE